MIKEIIICDIVGCKNEGAKCMEMQVIFTTEQTEGRCCSPYFKTVRIDICPHCLNHILATKKYIIVTGAQGYNCYHLKD